MSIKSGSVDSWRSYFRAANGDIFDIIDHAIMVAALDCPKEFKLRRDRIGEKLFTCKLTRCSGCEQVELAVPAGNEFDEDEDEIIDCKRDGRDFEAAARGSKESKVNSGIDDQHVSNNNQIASNYSYGEAEALTDEIEEESQVVGEVLRIKDILLNSKDESDSVLFDSLRRLELMGLTMDILKATEIGKAVNGLRKHGSKRIRHLARTLIDGWKELVDVWVNDTKVIAEGTPISVNPYVDEEGGLPFPPLDEGAFFPTETTGIELSQFFDGLDDDDWNPQNSGEFIKNRENGRKTSSENQNIPKRNLQTPNDANLLSKDNKSQQMKRQEAFMKPNKPTNVNFGLVRPPNQNMVQKVNNESKLPQRSEKVTIQKRPLGSQQDSSDEVAVQVKLEATTRKLHERYEEAQNAKRQRKIQVMELHDLPKQRLDHRNQQMRPGNHNRKWGNGRR